MSDAPYGLCCGGRHSGVVCPDELVMCQLCFERFPIEGLSLKDGIPIDVCQTCADLEKEMA